MRIRLRIVCKHRPIVGRPQYFILNNFSSNSQEFPEFPSKKTFWFAKPKDFMIFITKSEFVFFFPNLE